MRLSIIFEYANISVQAQDSFSVDLLTSSSTTAIDQNCHSGVSQWESSLRVP